MRILVTVTCLCVATLALAGESDPTFPVVFEGRVDAQNGGFVLAVTINECGNTRDHVLHYDGERQRDRLARVAARHGEIRVKGDASESADGTMTIHIKTFKEIDP